MIRILLLDDHAVVRSGYRRLIDAEPGMQVACEAECADSAYACLRQTEVDVALVDLNLRGSSGIDAVRRMLARAPELKVLVISMHEGAGFVTQAMRAGAVGYFTKSRDPVEMLDAIRGVAAGRRQLSPDVAQTLAAATLDGDELLTRLTPREFEVLRMTANGEPASNIARLLHLSQKTIHNHLSMIRQKLDAETDFKLLRLAARHGLVDFSAEAA